MATEPEVSRKPANANASATAAGSNDSPEAEGAEGEEDLDEGPGMSRNVVWGLSAGSTSMVVHLAILLIMGLWPSETPVEEPVIETEVVQSEVKKPEPPPQKPPERMPEKIQVQQNMQPVAKSAAAAANKGVTTSVVSSNVKPMINTTVSARPSTVKVNVGSMNILAMSGGQAVSAVPKGTLGDGLATAQNYQEAMDRLTQEILNMLAKKKVLLIWAMDQSESMNDDREEITQRIDVVYQQLGMSSASRGDALLTAVTSYGAGFANHTPKPTNDSKAIIEAIRSVPNDPSGEEMQCAALLSAISAYQPAAQNGNRQMAVVLLTDESGNPASNLAQLEATIEVATKADCKVYVLGREAVFGSRHARYRWYDEFKQVHWLPIDRGPETPDEEQLQINGLHRRWDAFPSGFGPYEQSRIARQTGGIFFLLPSPEVDLVGRRADLVYDGDTMRPYLPDLSARADYIADRDKSPFRKKIAEVINILDPYDGPYGDAASAARSKVEVRVDQFPIDRAAFAREANTNMQKALALITYLQTAQKELESVEPMRAREKSMRWKANYDLIYAQTIGFQARLQEYGWYLKEFIDNPKGITNKFGPSRPTNGWDVATVQRLLKPDVTKPLRERSDALLNQVVKDYPGTPWAARAQEELRRGYGIELNEDFEDPRSQGVKRPKF